MDKEAQVRERVRELRVVLHKFSGLCGHVSVGCILVWLLNGAGVFWPHLANYGFWNRGRLARCQVRPT